MIVDLCGYFKMGELIFDIINWYIIFIERFVGFIKYIKVKFRWMFDKLKNLEKVYLGLILFEVYFLCIFDGVRNLLLGGWIFLWL